MKACLELIIKGQTTHSSGWLLTCVNIVTVCVRGVSDRETEGEQGKEMQLNEYAAVLNSVKKIMITKHKLWRPVLMLN